jgi:hypothetical protein
METMERKKPRPRRSFTPEFKAEFAQILPHKTPEWQKVYATLRNSVEGMNGFIKDGAREAIDDPERRRIRGAAHQSVFVAFLLFAANLRKIDEFLKKQEAEANKVRKLPSRRRPSRRPPGPRKHPRSRPESWPSPAGPRSRCPSGPP